MTAATARIIETTKGGFLAIGDWYVDDDGNLQPVNEVPDHGAIKGDGWESEERGEGGKWETAGGSQSDASGKPVDLHGTSGGSAGAFTRVQEVSPEAFKSAFDKAMDGNPHTAYVSHYSLDEMREGGMKPLLSQDGRTGALIHDHGDGRVEATALFSTGAHGDGLRMLDEAIANHGVNYVECFGPLLNKMYESKGFKDDAVFPFDREQAPADWNYERDGTPDYHTMRLGK